ncbi:uncharacterized protein LOC120330815 [Styela clava]
MTENGGRGPRRCLFGREDHETLNQDLTAQVKEEERKSAEAFEKRWNFKIENETPLTGRYQWVKIKKTDTEPTTSRSVSHLPSSSASTEENVTSLVRSSPSEPTAPASDTEKSSLDEISFLSSPSNDSDVNERPNSSDEKDANQNVVKESAKRKAPGVLYSDESLKKEARLTKPP